jgi:hypothetical protein
MSSRETDEAPMSFPVYFAGRGSIYTKWIELTPKDLVSGGFSFETSKRISINADARVVVSDAPGSGSAYIQGRVVYRKKLAERRYRVGVEFLDFVNVSRDELLGICSSRDSRWAMTPTPTP